MKHVLLVVKRSMDILLEWLVILIVMVMVVDVLWGVITRFVLNSPSRWTEEIARLLLMWLALLGSAVAYRRNEHLGFDYVVGQLDPDVRKLLTLVSQGIVVAFALLVLGYGGLVLVTETLSANQVTPALGLKMGQVYLALPVSGFFITIYGIEKLFETFYADSTSETPRPEATCNQ